MEYRIRNDIDKAFYGVHVQLAEWIKRDGNQDDNGISAAFRVLEIYTRGYIEGRQESLIVTESERKQNIAFEVMQKKAQVAAAGLGILAEEPEKTQADIPATESEG